MSTPPSLSPSPPWIALLLLCALGGILRFHHLETNVLHMDEIHSIEATWKNSYSEIFGNFGVLDACVPLTLLNRYHFENGGFDEWDVRFPSALLGTLLVFLVALASRRLSPAEGILLTGSVAVSPYLIYLAREGRPYAVMQGFFAAAFLLTLRWIRSRGHWRFPLAALIAALTIWFQPVVLPAVAVLALCPLPSLIKRGGKADFINYALSAIGFVGLLYFLFHSGFEELEAQRALKTGRALITADTFLNSASFFLGFDDLKVSLILASVVTLIGAFVLGRRFPYPTLVLLLMTGLQVGAVFRTQPWGADMPWVAFRYLSHLAPFLLALIVVPLGAFIDWISGQRILPATLLSIILVGIYFGAQANLDHYVLDGRGQQNKHPQVQLLDDETSRRILETPIEIEGPGLRENAAFYQRFRDGELGPGGIIEIPATWFSPIYAHYGRIHQRKLRTGALSNLRWQYHFAKSSRGFDFESVFPIDSFNPKERGEFRYAIFHHKIFYEALLINHKSEQDPRLGPHTIATADMTEAFKYEFLGNLELDVPPILSKSGQLIYENEWIKVYDLAHPPE